MEHDSRQRAPSCKTVRHVGLFSCCGTAPLALADSGRAERAAPPRQQHPACRTGWVRTGRVSSALVRCVTALFGLSQPALRAATAPPCAFHSVIDRLLKRVDLSRKSSLPPTGHLRVTTRRADVRTEYTRVPCCWRAAIKRASCGWRASFEPAVGKDDWLTSEGTNPFRLAHGARAVPSAPSHTSGRASNVKALYQPSWRPPGRPW